MKYFLRSWGLALAGVVLGGMDLYAEEADRLQCTDLPGMIATVTRKHVEKNSFTVDLVRDALDDLVFSMDPRRKIISQEESQQLARRLAYTAHGQIVRGNCHFFRQIEIVFEKAAQESGEDLREFLKTIHEYRAEILAAAVLEAFDPHTTYLPPDSTFMSTEITGGVGLIIMRDPVTNLIRVDDVIEGGPASISGVIRPGAFIASVDGEPVEEITSHRVLEKLAGKAGTSVTLGILLPDECVSVEVVRQDVDQTPYLLRSTVVENGGKRIGFIQMKSFFGGSANILYTKVLEFWETGVQGILIDLRGNGGGFSLDAAKIGALFLGDRAIYGEMNSSTREVEFQGHPAGKLVKDAARALNSGGLPSTLDIPLAVLVDSQSASASELLAGALQSYRRAIVISPDSQTFGKGTVQVVENLEKGRGKFKYTVSRFYVPAGYSNQHRGIVPDIRLKNAGDEHENASSLLEKDLPHSLSSDSTQGVVTQKNVFYGNRLGAATQWMQDRSDQRVHKIRRSPGPYEDLDLEESLNVLSDLIAGHPALLGR